MSSQARRLHLLLAGNGNDGASDNLIGLALVVPDDCPSEHQGNGGHNVLEDGEQNWVNRGSVRQQAHEHANERGCGQNERELERRVSFALCWQ